MTVMVMLLYKSQCDGLLCKYTIILGRFIYTLQTTQKVV